MPYAQVDQYNVFYEKQGHGDCVLLMLPGSLGSTRIEFEQQFQQFDGDTFTLISWDAPGFGKSRPPARDYTDCYNRDAKLLLQLMTDLGVDKFHLLGFSDGGRTAMTIASQFADRVVKLVLVGATAFNSAKEKRVFELCASVATWSDQRRSIYEREYGADLQQMWTEWVQANHKLTDFVPLTQLRLITCPTLLLYGDNDIIAPIDPHARHLKRNLANSRIHIFSKTSHYCHQEKANEFNKIVEKFLLS